MNVDKEKELIKKVKEISQEYKSDIKDDNFSFLDKINELVRFIFEDPSVTIYDVFNRKNLKEWKRKNIIKNIKQKFLTNYKNLFYISLLITITGFLVSEALEFYAIDGIISTKTYVKAILTELCFIFLSGYRSGNKAEMTAVSILRASIFALMLFVITSKTFIDSSKTTSNTAIIEQQIVILEKQIKEKEKQMEYYLKKDWPRNYSSTRLEKEKLVEKLIKLKEKQASGANKDVSKLIQYKAYGKAFFRVLLLFISVLVTRRIFTF